MIRIAAITPYLDLGQANLAILLGVLFSSLLWLFSDIRLKKGAQNLYAL